MKKMTRRNFLQTSALAGAAALVSGMSVAAGAAAPEAASTAAAVDEENCINLAGTSPIEMASVQVKPGKLIGYLDDGMYRFLGVPYATAERFQSPKPIASYPNGWKLALTYGQVAPQDRCLNGTGEINGQEFRTPGALADMVANETCQYLNIWTKSLTGKKPVFVFFHGGGLENGASTELTIYNGEYFARREDAIFVSVNHRLNILGYLDLSQYGEQYATSAIAGEEDCREALRWVHDNIAQFGGDPSNVTILGQSGGGAKVTALACMSDTVDLFNKVVVVSGAFVSNVKEDGLANTKKLVDYLGLKDSEVVSKLTSMTYEELYKAYKGAGCAWNACAGNGTFGTPIIDKDGNVNPYAAQRKWMVGTTFSEFSSNTKAQIFNQDPTAALNNIDDAEAARRLQEKYGDRTDAVIDGFRAAYPTHKLCEALYLNAMPAGGLARWGLISPTGIITTMNKAGIPVYNYMVAYKMPFFGGQVMCHTSDLALWFGSMDGAAYQYRGDETNAQRVSNHMMDALAAFAASGDPSCKLLKWAPYTTDAHNTMVFDVKSGCKVDFDRAVYEAMMNQ